MRCFRLLKGIVQRVLKYPTAAVIQPTIMSQNPIAVFFRNPFPTRREIALSFILTTRIIPPRMLSAIAASFRSFAFFMPMKHKTIPATAPIKIKSTPSDTAEKSFDTSAKPFTPRLNAENTGKQNPIAMRAHPHR